MKNEDPEGLDTLVVRRRLEGLRDLANIVIEVSPNKNYWLTYTRRLRGSEQKDREPN